MAAITPAKSPVQDLAVTPKGPAGGLLSQAMGETPQDHKPGTNGKQYEYLGDPAISPSSTPAEAVSLESGASGTIVPNGFIVGEDYNAVLEGRQGILKFEEMYWSDATVRWSLQTMILPIRAAKFRIEPASDSARDQEIADFVTWNLFKRLNWDDTIRELMTFLRAGFYLAEKDFVPEDYNGKPMIVLRRLASRKQTTIFRWEQGDGSPGVQQITYQGTFNIPENRMFLITHEREGNNYAGRSLLRSSYKHWYIKDNLYKISAMAAERQGLGVLKIKQLSKPNKEERDAAIAAARNLRASESGYIEESPNTDISFMDMMAHTTLDATKDIEHHNRQIMTNVGAAFMEIGSHSGSGGTMGASGDQSEVYEMAVEAVANQIQAAFDSQVIRHIVDLNYTGVTEYPHMEHNKIGQDDIYAFGRAIAQLVGADALTPDPDLEQSLRGRYNLPDLPDEYRDDYANRPRAQADSVPIDAPIAVGPDGKPLPASQQPVAGKKPTQPKPNQGTKPTVKATEMVERVKTMYAAIGDDLDALTSSSA